jgi:hypothetical protein
VGQIWTGKHTTKEPTRTINTDEAALLQKALAIFNDRNSGLDFWAQGTIDSLCRATLICYSLFQGQKGLLPHAVNLACRKGLQLKPVAIFFQGDCDNAVVDLIDVSSNNQSGLWCNANGLKIKVRSEQADLGDIEGTVCFAVAWRDFGH